MKAIIKVIMSIIIVSGIIFTINACKKENPAQSHMTLKMTDAPADYLAVNVEVIGAKIHLEDQGWVDLPVTAGVYNLLDLQNDVTVTLANNVTLPVGKVNQMRLILGSNNTIVTLAGTFDLKVPSGEESGLKFNLDETLEPNTHVVVVLDFDAAASVVVTGEGEYILKPVIKVESITEI